MSVEISTNAQISIGINSKIKVSLNDIVADGLIIYLDAANTLCYPGIGTTAVDLALPNRYWDLLGGVSYDSTNGGSFLFDGTNDYLTPTNNFITGNSSKTVFFFMKSTDGSTTIRGIFGERVSSTGWGLANNYGSSGRLYYFHTSPGGTTAAIDSGGGYDVPTNQWCNYAITYDSPSGICKLYKNGIYTKQTTGNTDGVITSGTKIQIGTGAAGIYFQGNIGLIQVYNRALSDSEILRNYNTSKSRFGL